MQKKAKQTLVMQQDISDCGVACLLSAIRYFGGNTSLENLRELSGTTSMGTSLLGLCQGSRKLGLDADGFEAEIVHLKDLTDLSILQVVLENGLEHFVLNYGYDRSRQKFLIGDPANGVSYYKETELNILWKNKFLLLIKPNNSFIKAKAENASKRRWFISLIKEDYNILLTATFLGVIIACLSLSTAVFTQKLIDVIIPKHQISRMFGGFIMLLFLLLIKCGINYIRSLFILQQAKDFNERINSTFIEKLLMLPKAFFDSRKTGDLIARLNDTMRIQHSITYLSGTFIIDFLVVTISSVYLFHYHYSIAITALTTVPLMGLIARNYNNRIINQNTAVMGSYAANESNYIDTIQGISVIKSTNKQPVFAARTGDFFNAFQNSSIVLGKTGNRFNLIIEIIATIIILSVMAQTAYFTLHKQLKLGEMMAVLSIGIGIIPSCVRLMLTNLQIQEARVAYNRMYEFAAVEPEDCTLPNTEDKWDGHFSKLEIKDLSFRFTGRKQLFSGVDLIVKKGEITALLGESGCGKSTIIQVLQKFYKQQHGNIIVDEKYNLNDISAYQWRHVIAVVPQEVKIFNCSILENICLSTNNEDLERVFELCAKYGLENYFNQFPQSLLTKVGEEGINLSGGQKQIIALLRALFTQPQLLLLDEATASLDPGTESLILALLLTLKKNMGILLVTHKESTANIADHKVEMLKSDILAVVI